MSKLSNLFKVRLPDLFVNIDTSSNDHPMAFNSDHLALLNLAMSSKSDLVVQVSDSLLNLILSDFVFPPLLLCLYYIRWTAICQLFFYSFCKEIVPKWIQDFLSIFTY